MTRQPSQARPKVHGLRTYLPGARLAAHLDWPDAWVVSATLCVRRNASLPAWPVALSGVGIPGGTAEVSLCSPSPSLALAQALTLTL